MRSPYEVFLTIVECGSVSKACTLLNITQPALSRQLRKLEHDFGAELFERTATGMRLTNLGEALVTHAQTIVRADRSARLDISRLRENLQGHIVLGVTITSCMLPATTIEVLTRMSGLRVTIIEDKPHALLDKVRNNEIEFAICTSTFADGDPALTAEDLFPDSRMVVAASSHPIFGKKKIQPSDMLDYPWILPPVSFVTEWLDQVFGSFSLPSPIARIETRSLLQMLQGIEYGGLISVIPASAIRPELEQGVLKPILAESFAKNITVAAVYRNGRSLSRGARLLVDSIIRTEKRPSSKSFAKSITL